MCTMNCQNCYYKEINPDDDEGHCYMFKVAPSGECRQFKLSSEAKQSLERDLGQLNLGAKSGLQCLFVTKFVSN